MSEENFKALLDLHKTRKKDHLSKLFGADSSAADVLFVNNHTDLGVCRNGGRRGARFAPEAILNVLKKMTVHQDNLKLCEIHLGSIKGEEKGFAAHQLVNAQAIKVELEKFKGNLCIQLGGGHDHIYPLLNSLKDTPAIHVINIDAHLDTRQDNLPHSGTPFRQFDREYKGKFRLTQLGIHEFANAKSNYEDFKGKMDVISYESLADHTDGFTKPLGAILEGLITISADEITILSLDCDALLSSEMQGVSAVNHSGLPLREVKEFFEYYLKKTGNQKKYIGIYEYNPLFDNLSQQGAKSIASLLYRCIF